MHRLKQFKNFNNSNQISKEDSELFRYCIDNSTIFDKDKTKTLSQKKYPRFLKYRLINFAEFTASDKLFYNKNLDKKTIQRIKKGSVDISASIDLHGMNMSDACINLADFIYHNQNAKYLHIVHGKGYNANNLSKLKTQTFFYLKDHPQVMAIVSAPEFLGGTGAVIIGLKNV